MRLTAPPLACPCRARGEHHIGWRGACRVPASGKGSSDALGSKGLSGAAQPIGPRSCRCPAEGHPLTIMQADRPTGSASRRRAVGVEVGVGQAQGRPAPAQKACGDLSLRMATRSARAQTAPRRFSLPDRRSWPGFLVADLALIGGIEQGRSVNKSAQTSRGPGPGSRRAMDAVFRRQSAIHVEDGTVHVVVLDQLAHGEVDGLQARPGGAADLRVADGR